MFHAYANKRPRLPRGGRGCVRELAETPPRKSCLRPWLLLLLLLLLYSAGVGRTGTFITIDHILEQREEEGVIDIPGVIQNLRQQRTKIVQTVV